MSKSKRNSRFRRQGASDDAIVRKDYRLRLGSQRDLRIKVADAINWSALGYIVLVKEKANLIVFKLARCVRDRVRAWCEKEGLCFEALDRSYVSPAIAHKLQSFLRRMMLYATA